MIKNKEFIDAIIKHHKDFTFSVRTIADKVDEWSKFIPFVSTSENLIYKSKIIDGVKFKFKHTTLVINARHKFY